MVARFVIAPEAEQDISEAYAWYESRQVGLGEESLNCVDACVEGTLRNPEMHAVVHENYRRALIRRFPYALFYEYELGAVTIYSMFQTARDPAKWRQRLPS